MSIREILNSKGRSIFSTKPDVTLEEVSQLLSKHRVGACVVLEDDNTLCGILSERDIVRQIAKSGPSALEKPVSSCMTSNVIRCTEDETIDAAMQKMTDGRFRHLPVFEGETLSGIISIGDVVKRKIEQAERDAADLKQYIAG